MFPFHFFSLLTEVLLQPPSAGRKRQVVLDPPSSHPAALPRCQAVAASVTAPRAGQFPAKTSTDPLTRFRLQMKYHCRAEMGKMGFFRRHSVHCVNGLLINRGLP